VFAFITTGPRISSKRLCFGRGSWFTVVPRVRLRPRCQALGWIWGYIEKDFMRTFNAWAVGVVISVVVSGHLLLHGLPVLIELYTTTYLN